MGPTQPPMMSFKAFMEQCEENISDEEAVRKYSQYKLEFKRLQINEFFINHMEEEWSVLSLLLKIYELNSSKIKLTATT